MTDSPEGSEKEEPKTIIDLIKGLDEGEELTIHPTSDGFGIEVDSDIEDITLSLQFTISWDDMNEDVFVHEVNKKLVALRNS